MLIKVLVVLNRLINKNVNIIEIMLILKIVEKLSCMKVGVIFGGVDIMLFYCILLNMRLRVVIVKIVIIIVFLIL